MSSKAGFLDLPVELRLKIYQLLCHADVNCSILRDIEHSSDGRSGTQAKFINEDDTNLQKYVPWLGLASCCRTTAYEMRSFMNHASFLGQDHNRTYELDMNVYSPHRQPATRQVIWRSIPCPPNMIETLSINVAAMDGSPWTEGGPASMARAIYQVLNHFCHNGPRLVRQQPLSQHLRIRDLVINVDIGGLAKPPRSGCNVDPRWNYALLLSGFEQISHMGCLFGYVANIHVRGNGEYDGQMYAVDSCGVQSVPGAWKSFGFSWGV